MVKQVLKCPHCGERRENERLQSGIPIARVDESIPVDEEWDVHFVPASRTRTMTCQGCGEKFKFTWRTNPGV